MDMNPEQKVLVMVTLSPSRKDAVVCTYVTIADSMRKASADIFAFKSDIADVRLLYPVSPECADEVLQSPDVLSPTDKLKTRIEELDALTRSIVNVEVARIEGDA